ncbi:MAG: Transcriptional regulator, TetR family, partial [Verrucomicrobiales bacterium]|nr:Transcriptional regulator, TetR family [Verrucomicrobiales bacterium]
MRQVLSDGTRQWLEIMTRLIQEGMDAGSIRRVPSAGAAAAMVQDLWTGAMQRAAVERSSQPLRSAVDFIRQWLSPEAS